MILSLRQLKSCENVNVNIVYRPTLFRRSTRVYTSNDPKLAILGSKFQAALLPDTRDTPIVNRELCESPEAPDTNAASKSHKMTSVPFFSRANDLRWRRFRLPCPRQR